MSIRSRDEVWMQAKQTPARYFCLHRHLTTRLLLNAAPQPSSHFYNRFWSRLSKETHTVACFCADRWRTHQRGEPLAQRLAGTAGDYVHCIGRVIGERAEQLEHGLRRLGVNCCDFLAAAALLSVGRPRIQSPVIVQQEQPLFCPAVTGICLRVHRLWLSDSLLALAAQQPFRVNHTLKMRQLGEGKWLSGQPGLSALHRLRVERVSIYGSRNGGCNSKTFQGFTNTPHSL